MRFFNTEGPNLADDRYSLPPLERWDLAEILTLIDRKKHFLLHAPRQTGKTTCLLAMIEQAKENLILRRVTHLDQLADKLREPRVRRVIEPTLAGTSLGEVPEDDIQYLIDLGLCRMAPGPGADDRKSDLSRGPAPYSGLHASGWLVIFDRRTGQPPIARAASRRAARRADTSAWCAPEPDREGPDERNDTDPERLPKNNSAAPRDKSRLRKFKIAAS